MCLSFLRKQEFSLFVFPPHPAVPSAPLASRRPGERRVAPFG